LRNSYQEYVAPFNSNFHNKALCESGVMWITRFVTYLSITFHIYLLIPEHKKTRHITLGIQVLTWYVLRFSIYLLILYLNLCILWMEDIHFKINCM
jgi:hypothetical protein